MKQASYNSYKKYLEKENSASLDQLLYKGRPPRSVYNSPLVHTQTWKCALSNVEKVASPSLGNVFSSTASSVGKIREWLYNSPSVVENSRGEGESIAAVRQIEFKDDSPDPVVINSKNGQKVTAKIISFAPKLSLAVIPSTPEQKSKRLDDDDDDIIATSGTLKTQKSITKAISVASGLSDRAFIKNVCMFPNASSTYADLTSNNIDNDKIDHVLVPSAPHKESISGCASGSSNELQDTYDMDDFLKQALGSQLLSAESSDLSELNMSDIPSELLKSPYNCKSLVDKIMEDFGNQNRPSILQATGGKSDKEWLMKQADKEKKSIENMSTALNICYATKGFTKSSALVEGEGILLEATLKNRAIVEMIQELSENPPDAVPNTLQGTLTFSDITVNLKEYTTSKRKSASEDQWFICVLSYKHKIVVSKPVLLKRGSKSLHFKDKLELSGLPYSFAAKLQIYSMQTCEYQSSSKIMKVAHAYKMLRCRSSTCLHSGESNEQLSSIRLPSFVLAGSTGINTDHLGDLQQPITLSFEQVLLLKQLEGTLSVDIKTKLMSSLKADSFLNVLEIAEDMQFWQCRWCHFDGVTLYFWNYPTEQEEKVPLNTINLLDCCTEVVETAPRHLCSRPRTFMLETTRSCSPRDLNSTMLICDGEITTVRHFLSCENARELREWCYILNESLKALRKWKLS